MPALVSEMSAKSMEEASVKFLVLIFLLAIFKLHLGEEGLREGTVRELGSLALCSESVFTEHGRVCVANPLSHQYSVDCPNDGVGKSNHEGLNVSFSGSCLGYRLGICFTSRAAVTPVIGAGGASQPFPREKTTYVQLAWREKTVRLACKTT